MNNQRKTIVQVRRAKGRMRRRSEREGFNKGYICGHHIAVEIRGKTLIPTLGSGVPKKETAKGSGRKFRAIRAGVTDISNTAKNAKR